MTSELDPEIAALLKWVEHSDLRPLNELSVEAARAQFADGVLKLDQAPVRMESVAEKAIGRESGFVRSRLYTPPGIATPSPLLIWFHGGGWTIGDLDTADRVARALAAGAEVRVLSVGYALGPEARFPAAVDDAMLVYRHVIGTPGDYGADPARIAVGGDSAGGNLAAVVTHLARDGGLARPSFQLLIYPSTDLHGDFASRRAFGQGYLLTSAVMDWFAARYLPASADPRDPRVSPLHFPDFSGLPPAYVQTAGFDPLKDEAAAYVARLSSAKVPVDHDHYPGLIHGYFTMAGAVKAAKAAVDTAAAALARGLGTRA